jgi:hypothetical protein
VSAGARLEEHAFRLVAEALDGVDAAEARNVYALSLLPWPEDDDPRRNVITLGFNTEARVAAALAGATGAGVVPTDALEARWNYAFWLRNSLVEIGRAGADDVGAELRTAWMQSLGLWYSDQEAEADLEAAMERAASFGDHFWELTVRLAQELFSAGVVERALGRVVPILVHEFEYHADIAEYTRAANPPGLADGFLRWIASLG